MSSEPHASSSVTLTLSNYRKGFLIDDEWLAGVSPSEDPEQPGFTAYVIQHQMGTLLAQTTFPTLEDALSALQKLKRNWSFESTHQCGGGSCKSGGCAAGGGCGAEVETCSSPDSTSPKKGNCAGCGACSDGSLCAV